MKKSLRTLVLLIVVLEALVACPTIVATEPVYDATFPAEVEHWLTQTASYDLGLVEADALRKRVMSSAKPAGGQNSQTVADLIAATTAEFQRQMSGRSELGVSVAGFNLSAQRLTSQLSGEMHWDHSQTAFDGFNGRWFGLWDTTPVNHDWRPSRVHGDPAPNKDSQAHPQVTVLADQYAWISNGFGWNYLVRSASSQPYVLGQVYYLDSQDLTKIESRKPHVGFADLPQDAPSAMTRLVWITEQEIYLEEVFPQPDPLETVYAITGIYHQLFADKPSVSDRAVQAVYTRRSQRRPPFQRLQWQPPSALSE